MIGTIEPPKSAGGCGCMTIVLFIFLFVIPSMLWSLVCPIYDYKREGERISFEHLVFNKSSVKGKVTQHSDGDPIDNIFKGSWKANRLILTFQDGGQPEEAIIADSGILFFRGKTFTGERVYFNIPFLPGV
jgi:hypothetical protein